MGNVQSKRASQEKTAVDDVRRISEEFDRESGDDIRKHVEQTNRVVEELREKRELVILKGVPPKMPRDGSGEGKSVA